MINQSAIALAVGAFVAGSASGGLLELDLGSEAAGVINGVGPRSAMLTYDPTSDSSRTSSMNLRLLNKVGATMGITNPDNAIDGNLSRFARVGGTGAGSPGDNDGVDGRLTLTFDNGYTFTRNDTIVFDEFGSEDEPFSISVDIAGMTFDISTDIANTQDGVTETEVSDGGKIHRIYELDLSGAYFEPLAGTTFNSFTIIDQAGDTNLSPDIVFAGIRSIPLPGPAGLAGLGLLAGVSRRTRR